MESFEFFANSVLGEAFPQELCECVQDCVEERENFCLETKTPRSVAIALVAWLASQNVQVLADATLPQGEVLKWLELNEPSDVSPAGESAVLEVQEKSVRVTWV